jgi:hypothetical protein
MPDSGDGKSSFFKPFDLFLTAIFSLFVYVISQQDALSNPYAINDDVRQQIYWMQAWQDSSIYGSNLLNDYARQYVPCGVKAIYLLASIAIDPLTFSKVLTGIIFVILGTLIFITGRLLKSRSLGWACLATYWLMPFFLDTISGGIARSFAFPLIVLFMLGWFTAKPWVVTFTLLLQALLIPYIFLLCLSAVIISLFFWKTGILHEPAIPFNPGHLAVIFTGFVIAASMKYLFELHGFGPMVSRPEMNGNPLFTQAGRYEIGTIPAILQDMVIKPWEWIAGFHELGTIGGIVSVPVIAGAAVLGACFAEWKSLKRFLPASIIFFLTSLGMYFLAYILLLKLFVPDRFIMYTINLFYCFLLAIAFHALWTRYGKSRFVGTCLVIMAMMIGTLRLRNVGVFDYSSSALLYAAVEKTPKTSLFAAHPWLADNVLTFGKRNVLVSFELAHPWARGYWLKIEPRLSDFFNAYYASSPETICAFCCKYGVDFIVVDRRDFEPSFISGKPFFAPFDMQIKALSATSGEFYLTSSNGFDSIRVNEYLSLIDTHSCCLAGTQPAKEKKP